jgi:hypothetical protein
VCIGVAEILYDASGSLELKPRMLLRVFEEGAFDAIGRSDLSWPTFKFLERSEMGVSEVYRAADDRCSGTSC